MAEIITLTTPILKPSQASVRLERLTIDIESKSILVTWLGNNGESGRAFYPTPAPQGSSQPTGAALITTLNSANLSTLSLAKRVLQRLQTDGYIGAGAVAGAPD